MIEDMSVPIKIANDLRNQGISTEIFLNDKKLKAKMKLIEIYKKIFKNSSKLHPLGMGEINFDEF